MKTILLNTIREVGDLILEKSRSGYAIKQKEGVNNLVTEVDEAAERMIKEKILDAYPDHGFIGEEYGIERPEATYKWIIDPIDGTVNYAHQIPLYCVSIALAKEDELILGAIYNPVLRELFYAEKGKGAYLNDMPIRVSSNPDWQSAFLVTGFPYVFPEGIDVAKIFADVVNEGLPVRRLGSAALDLAYVACGRFDGFWEYNLNPWDIAAGYLLVKEAGGKVSDFAGEEGHFMHRQTLATNGLIHNALKSKIMESIAE